MNILILDDVRLVRETVKESLSSLTDWNLTVREASNGFDALDIVEKSDIDVVLVDIKMPKMNGLEFIKKASQINESLHFIILSSFSEFDYARSALKMGVSDYLLKPVSDEELTSVLSRIHREMKSEEQQKLSTLEQELHRFLNHPIREKTPDNALFFCFHPRAGIITDVTFYKRINQITDDLSRRLNGKGISSFIRSGDNQWHCLLYTDRDQLNRIKREIVETAGLMDTIHLFLIEPDKLAVSPCFSEHRSLFFRNLSALALVVNSDDFQEKINDFSTVIDALRELGDTLTALTRGIYMPWRKLNDSLVRILDVLSAISPLGESVVMQHLLCIFSIPASDSEGEMRSPLLQKIEAEYMRLQFKSDVPFPGNVVAYVRNNYMYPINISEIAQHLGMTPNALSSAFKKSDGNTLNRYITSVRMEKAEKLLLSTELNSRQIGEMVGMTDAGYFCKVFKEYRGYSPMEYRKRHINGK